MNKIIIDCGKDILRTAVVDEKGLVELMIDRKENESIVGNIYVGVVKNILPNQFAFIDIGGEKNGFLFLTDKKEMNLYAKETGKLAVKPGQCLLVQAVKDETGQKGPYVTSQISFSGRLCVLIQSGTATKAIAVSKKITEDQERKRLKTIAAAVLPDGYELIIRTNCAGRAPAEIETEIRALLEKAANIAAQWRFLKAPCLADKQENPLNKNLKDLYHEGIAEIIINNEKACAAASATVRDYFDGAEDRIRFYNDEKPIFHYYDIECQIQKLFGKKIWLQSGGFIIIEQTEACVVVDVNSGKFSGKKNHEQSSLKLNIEAGREIARQIRLRNLCGIIIIDFIDMKTDESRDALMKAFADALAKDRISTHLVGITNLGLVEVTRKKMREPLLNVLSGKAKENQP